MLTPWMVMEIISNDIIKPNFTEIIIILYLGIFSTVLANVWFAIGIEKIGPTSSSAYIFLVPVFGVLSWMDSLRRKYWNINDIRVHINCNGGVREGANRK